MGALAPNSSAPILSPLFRGIHAPLATFHPVSLFAAGEQGAIYDPSVMASMYQDAAGTTPVTALEQPVGLMLDGRFGYARGAEMAYAGYASANDNGTVIDSPTAFHATAGTTSTRSYLNLATVAGKSYVVTCRVATQTAQVSLFARDGSGGVGTVLASNGGGFVGATIGLVFVATSAASNLLWSTSTNSATFTIDNISIRELPGNHASQATAAARPVLSARKNQLIATADMTNAAWLASSATKVDARRVDIAAGFSNNVRQLGPASPVGTTMTYSVLLSGTGVVNMVITDEGGGFPGTGLLVNLTAVPTLYTLTRTQADAASTRMSARLVNGSATVAASVYVDNPQLEYGTTATRYQRVNTATDYDAVGFPVYLKGDGVDDCALNTTYAPGTAQTVMQALAYCATNASQDSFSALGNDGGIGLALDSGGQFYFRYGTGAALGSLKPVSRVAAAGVPVVFGGWSDGANIGTFVNSDADTTAAVAVPAHSPAGFTVFAWTGGAVERANAAIYGHVHIARNLTTAQKASLKRWLAAKAGVTLP